MLARQSNGIFLAAAQYILTLGLCPVLLDGKRPIFENYSGYLAGPGGADEMMLPPDRRPLRYTAGLLEAWADQYPWANLGMLCRERPTIDIDDASIWPIIRDLIPFTPHIKRGARGFSLIYSQSASDPVIRTRTFKSQFSGDMVLEVLAHGRQTVIPPSIHPDTGHPYEWIALPDLGVMVPEPLHGRAPPPLSQATVEAIEARLIEFGVLKRRIERGEGLVRSLGDGERTRYDAFLAPKLAERLAAVREAPGGARQDSLNGACFALAPWVREGFVDEVELEAGLREACMLNGYIGEHGDKAFTRQFAKAIDEGWAHELPDLDAGRAAALMGPAPAMPAHLLLPATVVAPIAQSFWTYDGTLPEEEPELIRRLLPATAGHIAFIAGKSGMGKSFFACSMAVALAMGPGTSFFGHPVRERVGTIIVANEDAGGLPARLYAAAREMGATDALPIVVISNSGNLCNEAQRATLGATLANASAHLMARFGVRVGAVVFDTLSATFGMSDEQDSAEANRICGWLRDMSRPIGAVAVPVHHVGKDGAQGMRGSSAYYAAADHVTVCGGAHDHETGVTENRYLAVDKSRNDVTGLIANVELVTVELGVNRYGEPRSTAFYKMGEGKVEPKGAKKIGLHDAVFHKAFDAALLRDGGEGVPDPILRMQFYLLNHAGSQDAKKKAYARTRDKFINDGVYSCENDVWMRV